MKTTVITHFWDEETLLPYWLKHHLELFDHGILINYRSTDRSVEIIKELAPHWDLVDTTNPDFKPGPCDREVESYEMQHEGWKLALNVTEFAFCGNLQVFLKEFEETFPDLDAFRTSGIIMVDSEEEQARPLTEEPLLLQRRHGYIERDHRNPITQGVICSRSRLFHKREHGDYTPGRHILKGYGNLGQINEKLGVSIGGGHHIHRTGIHPGFYLGWFGKFSPFEYVKERYLKLNNQRNNPAESVEWSRPRHMPQYMAELVEQRKRAVDLCNIPEYNQIYQELKLANSYNRA